MATTTLPERGDLRVLGHRGRAEGEARRGRPGRSHRDRPDRSGSPDRPAYTNTGSSFLDPWDRRLPRTGRATSFGRSYWHNIDRKSTRLNSSHLGISYA